MKNATQGNKAIQTGETIYRQYVGMSDEDIEAMYDATMAAAGTDLTLLGKSVDFTRALIALIQDADIRYSVEGDAEDLVEILQRDAYTYAYRTIIQEGKLGTTLRTAFYKWRDREYKTSADVMRLYNLLWSHIKGTYSIGMTATPAARRAWEALRDYLDTASMAAFRLGYQTGRISSRLVSILAGGV